MYNIPAYIQYIHTVHTYIHTYIQYIHTLVFAVTALCPTKASVFNFTHHTPVQQNISNYLNWVLQTYIHTYIHTYIPSMLVPCLGGHGMAWDGVGWLTVP